METTEVIVLGGGLVGLTTAIGLARNGIDVTVFDPQAPVTAVAPAYDGRVTAIASASWRMLEVLGLADALRADACPIDRIEVRDGPQRDALDFTPTDGEPLGHMVENRRLRVALSAAAAVQDGLHLNAPSLVPHVERSAAGIVATLPDGQQWRAQLIVAAEGRNSPSRDGAGLRSARWAYDHHAIVAVIEHDRPHGNVAHEIFYPSGPFALLPMPGGYRSSLVWSVPGKDGDGVLALGDVAFRAEIQRLSCGVIGTIGAMTPRQRYTLGFHHSATMTAPRLALVGDAAHGIHPLAGQGLNLGLRDAAALVEVLVDGSRLGLDLGDAQLLDRYQRWRGLDVLATASATDLFTRLFGIPGRSPRAVRRFGLAAVERIAPLKAAFMAEARGELGKLPRLLQGVAV